MKTLTLSELISELEDIKNTEGDLPVVISSDEEGNSYGILDKSFLYDARHGVIVVFPAGEIDDPTDALDEDEDDSPDYEEEEDE